MNRESELTPGDFLVLTENKEQLADKLSEYKKRLDPSKAPELQFDTHYKIAVADELVNNGSVNYDAVAKQLKERFGEVNEQLLQNAWLVISDYAKTGGKHTVGGTGLPKRGPQG